MVSQQKQNTACIRKFKRFIERVDLSRYM